MNVLILKDFEFLLICSKMNFNGGINSNKVASGEKFFLIRIKNEMKSSLFTSMYVILKEEPPPNLFYIFVYIIYFLQLLYIPLHTNVTTSQLSIYYKFISSKDSGTTTIFPPTSSLLSPTST